MTLEEVIVKQAELKLGGDHLVYLDETKWFCAHTDEERAEGVETMANCPLNDWLQGHDGPPEAPGFHYVATPDPWGWELTRIP